MSKSLPAIKAKPSDSCQQSPGVFAPIVDRRRCEGKSDCVRVCPYGVFEVRRIAHEDYSPLPWLAKLKVRAHGMKTAYTPNAADCRACSLCITACPEHAIRLEKVTTTEN